MREPTLDRPILLSKPSTTCPTGPGSHMGILVEVAYLEGVSEGQAGQEIIQVTYFGCEMSSLSCVSRGGGGMRERNEGGALGE